VRLVLAGTPEVALPSLEALAASHHEVVTVVTRPDAPAGRGRTLVPSPVRVRAEALGLPVLAPATPRDPQFQDALRALAPDACPVVAYGALIPRAALDIPRHGWVNLHFSLLPAWRGAAPVQRAVMAGDEVTGASTFVIEEGLDTGPVLGTMTETVRPRDTSGDVLDRLAVAGASLLVATMDGLEDGTLEARPQPTEGVSLAPKLTVEEARVDWTWPAHVVDRRVRGCTPAPGAWTMFRGDRLKLAPVQPLRADELEERPDPHGSPGTLVVSKRDVVVATGTGAVRLTTVQAHGKKAMRAADWARGLRIAAGERLGDA
jgi:methionyl-tRNA formyltransferase